jgi:hypothetical protein
MLPPSTRGIKKFLIFIVAGIAGHLRRVRPAVVVTFGPDGLNASELTIFGRYPLAAHTNASEAPVLPPVYSTKVSPDLSRPSASGRDSTANAMRCLPAPPAPAGQTGGCGERRTPVVVIS